LPNNEEYVSDLTKANCSPLFLGSVFAACFTSCKSVLSSLIMSGLGLFLTLLLFMLSLCVEIRDSNLTEEGLKQTIITKFQDLNHVPVWHSERPKAIQGNGRLRIHRIYPVGLNQRQALYEWSIQGDEEVRKLVTEHPCPILEVIFV
jgi:hypothetical protein